MVRCRTIAIQSSDIATIWPNKAVERTPEEMEEWFEDALELFEGCGIEGPPEQLVEELPEIDERERTFRRPLHALFGQFLARAGQEPKLLLKQNYRR